ncbi:hypothetical protein PLESTF_000206300 [Pleodorina starrii]|nr:hypothetical protein PLESTF_000206300 [Pleodorina starrii]
MATQTIIKTHPFGPRRTQRELKDAEAERASMTTRLREEVAEAEQRCHDLEQQLHHAQQQLLQQQQLQQEQHQAMEVCQRKSHPDDATFGNGGGGTAEAGSSGNGGALGAGRNARWPAGPEGAVRPLLSPASAAFPSVSPASHPLPPMLHLDPAHLLVEADLDVGFTRADIETELHQLGSELEWLCRNEELLRPASALIDITGNAAIPWGMVRAVPSDVLDALRPAFLGHTLLYWMTTTLWPDPLDQLGCAPFSLLDTVPAAGDAERNLLLLLRSHVARKWLPVVRRAMHMVSEAAGHQQDGPRRLGALLEQRDRPQDAGIKAVLSASVKAVDALAEWFWRYPYLAHSIKHNPFFSALLLRALQLGLMVQAAHPLLRLYVATPMVEQRDRMPASLDSVSQDALPRVRLVRKSGYVTQTGGGSFVLCSVRPGVRFDVQAAAAAGVATPAAGGQQHAAAAGPGGGVRPEWVLLKEEVVTWEWDALP